MNANELADELEKILQHETSWDIDFVETIAMQAATMLRQQQAEIEALKAKTLTDEEIYEVWCDAIKEEAIVNKGKPPILKYQPFVFFARAILRKAQENAPNNL